MNSTSNTSTPPVNAPVLDWLTTPLHEDYAGYYVKIVDNVFNDDECAALIALAESDSQWKQAAVHYGMGANENYVNTNYRNSERILRFDHDAAEKLYQKLLPYVQELVEVRQGSEWETIFGKKGYVTGTWSLIGLNERLSFLRYGKGNYFRGHCDGQLDLPDGRKSRATLQIYLGDEGVEGGATRIKGYKHGFYDVEPKKGRVLIFQQRGLYHSGEDVTSGVKYTLRTDFLFRHSRDESA